MQSGICPSRRDDNCGGGTGDATASDSPCAMNGATSVGKLGLADYTTNCSRPPAKDDGLPCRSTAVVRRCRPAQCSRTVALQCTGGASESAGTRRAELLCRGERATRQRGSSGGSIRDGGTEEARPSCPRCRRAAVHMLTYSGSGQESGSGGQAEKSGRLSSWTAPVGCREHPNQVLLLQVEIPHTDAPGRRVRITVGGEKGSREGKGPAQITAKTKHRPRHESRRRLGSDWDLAATSMRWIGRQCGSRTK